MDIKEALKQCMNVCKKVRPVSWRNINPGHWVEFRSHHFVECGEREEMPHALRLAYPDEFLGEWEVLQ